MRTHYCGELRKKNVGEVVHLYGWVNKARNLGGLMFIDLRDVSGICQVVCKPENEYYNLASSCHNEYVLDVTGTVVSRESVNNNIPTGEVEVDLVSLKIINKSEPLPVDKNSNDELRLKYRYLDLRRPELQEIFKTKAKIVNIVRNYMADNNFIDCETPILCKSTPEGARDYLVPSRVFKGEFYALPQSPQILKQLLMVAGFDRYYQIAKCFRDEDLRADRQPEFTQIDIETSFLDQDELLTIIEGMIKKLWKEILNQDVATPFMRMKWDDAMKDYGSDKPDTRFGLKLEHRDSFKSIDSPLFNGKYHVSITANDENQIFTRKKLDNLTDYIKKHGGENLLYVKKVNGQYSGSIVKLLSDEILESLNLKDNDILFITTHANYLKAVGAMGSLRLVVGDELGLIDKSMYDFKWVVEFPLFEKAEDGSITSSHHPFTRPLAEHVKYFGVDPLKIYSYSYDLVACGYEVGGGSLRIYDLDVQQKVFETLNINEEQQKAKFGYLLDAMKYGCPPHGGLAFGLERLTMILINSQNIRDVVLFPKTTSAQDLMLDCPSEVDELQLKELGIMKDESVINE